VVRNLPPQLNEEQFRTTVESLRIPISNNDVVDFYYYAPGATSDKKVVNSRAYLSFTSLERMAEFAEKFNGHIFVTSKGHEQRALVELSPFQKTPKSKKKADAREETITADSDYIHFLEELKKPVPSLPSAEEQLDKRLEKEREMAAQSGGSLPPQTTPLLEYLKNKKIIKIQKREQRIAEKAERKKRKDLKKEKLKEEKKRRDRSSSKQKEDKERKKKKKESYEKKGERSKEKSVDGSNRGGIWMIRKHLEPGSIAIQTRQPSSDTIAMESTPSSQSTPKDIVKKDRDYQSGSSDSSSKKFSGNRKTNRSEGSKMYAPKVYAPKSFQPIQNGS